MDGHAKGDPRSNAAEQVEVPPFLQHVLVEVAVAPLNEHQFPPLAWQATQV